MLSAEGTSSTQCAWPAPSLVPTSGQSQNTSNYCHMSFHTLHHAPSHTIYCAPARTRYPKMASECILNHVKTTVHHIMLVEGNSLISCKPDSGRSQSMICQLHTRSGCSQTNQSCASWIQVSCKPEGVSCQPSHVTVHHTRSLLWKEKTCLART